MPLMTESTAKEKWCPFVRTGAYTDRGELRAISVNRDSRPEIEIACRCIASKCMAWRWLVKEAHPESSMVSKRLPVEQWKGYCGLMARPE